MSLTSKIKKGIKNPKLILKYLKSKKGAVKKFMCIHTKEKIVFCVNMAVWKREILEKYYPDNKYVFIPLNYSAKKMKKYYDQNSNMEFLIWGYGESESIINFIKKYKIKLNRIEDGFIRSIGLGASHTLPLSLVIDNNELYFSKRNNRLREILNTYDFKNDPELIERSKKNIKFIVENDISKYNFKKGDAQYIELPPKTKKRVLVVGQVETDASIKHGMDIPMTNNELVKLAYEQNKDAEIYYKPHPDVLLGFRERVSDEKEVSDISTIIKDNIPISLLMTQGFDHVYTMTSLSGFEALIRGIEVTTVGKPFYAGWGLTNDISAMDDRNRKLTVEEVFAGAYILYSDYFDDETYKKVEIEDVLEKIRVGITA